MNKIFIALFVFVFAVAAAQPPTQKQQCETNTQMVLNMAKFVDKVVKGEGNCYN